ncbi:MAG: hypothetical protein DDT20_00942 [Firmicutes bacterium]|nr:hypothetical protein [Bacillota bacterium]
MTFRVRVLCWFSCGAASAVAAKLAVEKYGARCEVLYCDTLKYEHPDNKRFMADVARWLGLEIKTIRSTKYEDIFDVFNKTGWLVGPGGARCTTELKKLPRRAYQREDDLHVFGLCAGEQKRISQFEANNPELTCEWNLRDLGVTHALSIWALKDSGIKPPVMYELGYRNNNCIGCVKGQAGYWNKIRIDFPEAFSRMAAQERKMNVAINKSYAGDGKRKVIFLDELPPGMGHYEAEPSIECGVVCSEGGK